jgi:hypothetical protein
MECIEKLRKRGVILQSGPCVDIGDVLSNLSTGTYTFKKPEFGWVSESFPFVLILKTDPAQNIEAAIESVPGVKEQKRGPICAIHGSDNLGA